MTKKEVIKVFKETLDVLNNVTKSNNVKAEALYQALVDLVNKTENNNVNRN